MFKTTIVYRSEDAAFDQMDFLENFKDLNIHPEHNNDIDKVKYEKVGNAIKFSSEDEEALNYVVQFASEEEDGVAYVSKESSVQ